jgi:DNA polymerase-1
VGAVQGFCNMLWKLLRDMQGDTPTHLAVIWDHSEKTFRNTLYDKYKAHRPPPPEDLIPQFPLVREATLAFGVPAIELPGYEADDLIAAYACKARELGGEAVIVSSDKDLMQLVGDGVSMFDPMKGLRIEREQVFEKFGVYPDKVVDVQALCGDSVDNVPGAPGIGIKTAAQLITEYGDLDTLLARAGEIKQPKRRETLIEFADQIRLSRALVKLDCDTPLPEPLDDLTVREPDKEVLAAFLEQMEFRTLARRVGDGSAAMARARWVCPGAIALPAQGPGQHRLVHGRGRPRRRQSGGRAGDDRPRRLCPHPDLETLQAWVAKATAKGVVAFDTETDALSSANAGLCGVSLAINAGEACYIPIGHCEKDGLALEAAADLVQIPLDDVIATLKPLLEDPAVLKVAQNAKYDIAVLARARHPRRADRGHHADQLRAGGRSARPRHGRAVRAAPGPQADPVQAGGGTGKGQISFKHVGLNEATAYAAEDADVTLRLYEILKPRLAREGLLDGLRDPGAADAGRAGGDGERGGHPVDPEALRLLSNEFSMRMAKFEERAQELVGRPFNLGSPKQIGDVLFGEMNMKGGKKTATGQWSTDSDVLESLALEHELPRVLLDWRQLSS